MRCFLYQTTTVKYRNNNTPLWRLALVWLGDRDTVNSNFLNALFTQPSKGWPVVILRIPNHCLSWEFPRILLRSKTLSATGPGGLPQAGISLLLANSLHPLLHWPVSLLLKFWLLICTVFPGPKWSNFSDTVKRFRYLILACITLKDIEQAILFSLQLHLNGPFQLAYKPKRFTSAQSGQLLISWTTLCDLCASFSSNILLPLAHYLKLIWTESVKPSTDLQDVIPGYRTIFS